jgi:hypothetical protein
LFGACTPGKLQICFVYLSELVPEKHRTIVGTLILFADASTMSLLPLYFRFVTKEWSYFQIGSLFMNIISVLGILFFLPESPKYLHAKGLKLKSLEVIRYIAKFNGKKREEIENIDVN